MGAIGLGCLAGCTSVLGLSGSPEYVAEDRFDEAQNSLKQTEFWWKTRALYLAYQQKYKSHLVYTPPLSLHSVLNDQ